MSRKSNLRSTLPRRKIPEVLYSTPTRPLRPHQVDPRSGSTLEEVIAFLIFLACFAAGVWQCEPEPVAAQGGSEAEIVLAAGLCVHEANWSGGVGGGNDCGAIVQVVTNRQIGYWDGRTGRTFTETLRDTSPRFFHGLTPRAWARHLNRRGPPGWPSEYPPFFVFRERYESVLDRTRGFMLGSEEFPCEEPVVRWYGRDGEEQMLADLDGGDWRLAHCGETVNRFAYRVDVD